MTKPEQTGKSPDNNRDGRSPQLHFIIAGIQKCGTTALAQYLARHPGLALPDRKEAHVLDAPDFDDGWSPAEVDARFALHFTDARPAQKRGDATPATLFVPEAIDRAARHYPALRWIVLLRDPVDRALSHYHMARRRGHERLPLWLAVIAEPLRLRLAHRHRDAYRARRISYVARGRYAAQLDRLFARVPREQVLLLRSSDLLHDPAAVVAQVHEFLSVPALPDAADLAPVTVGGYARPPVWSPGLWLLRWRLAGETTALARRHGIAL